MKIQQFLIQKIGNPLEWDSAGKASLLLWMYLSDQLFYQLFIELGMSHPQLIPWVNQAEAQFHSFYFLLLLLVTLGLLAILHTPQARKHASILYEYIACLYFGISHVYYAYCIGLASLPVGVVLLGAPVVGFIIVNHWAVVSAFVASILLMLVLSIATMLDHIPYAPLVLGLYRESGQMEPAWVVAYAVFALPHVVFIFALAHYVLQRWRAREEEAIYLSRTDGLTGLLNRRYVLKMLEQEKHECETGKMPMAVIMVDLDHFKGINDNWGHDVGDDVLVKAAQVLKQSVRLGDYVGRYGGEEFLVVLPGLDEAQAVGLAERIRGNIAAIQVALDGGDILTLSASLGLSCYTGSPFVSQDDLVRRADVALYQAKAGGRDCVMVATA